MHRSNETTHTTSSNLSVWRDDNKGAICQLEALALKGPGESSLKKHLITDLRIPEGAVASTAAAILNEIRYFENLYELSTRTSKTAGASTTPFTSRVKEGTTWCDSSTYQSRQFASFVINRALAHIQGGPPITGPLEEMTLCVHQTANLQQQTLQWLKRRKTDEPVVVLAGGAYPINSPHFFTMTKHSGGKVIFSIDGESGSLAPYSQDLTVSAKRITLLGGYLDMCAARALRASLKAARTAGVMEAMVQVETALSYLEGYPPRRLIQTLTPMSLDQRKEKLQMVVGDMFGNAETVTQLQGYSYSIDISADYPRTLILFK